MHRPALRPWLRDDGIYLRRSPVWAETRATRHGWRWCRCGGQFKKDGELFLGNAGTAMRPLTAAVAAAGKGKYVLDGVARMRERPIQDLVDGLNQLGVKATCTLGTGCPPVEVLSSQQGGWFEKIEEGILRR
jgi:5-enolpyruvylshikimate-3-phosphate synthase